MRKYIKDILSGKKLLGSIKRRGDKNKMKKYLLQVEDVTWQQLKVKCAQRGITIKKKLDDMIVDYVKESK